MKLHLPYLEAGSPDNQELPLPSGYQGGQIHVMLRWEDLSWDAAKASEGALACIGRGHISELDVANT